MTGMARTGTGYDKYRLDSIRYALKFMKYSI
jgi:hypothetical protein